MERPLLAGFYARETRRFVAASVSAERTRFTFDNATGKTMIVQVQDRGRSPKGVDPILKTRGWALQESALSHRIVQCVQSELYWRCNHGCQTESGLLLPPSASLPWNVPVSDLKDMSDPRKVWWKLMGGYSRREFTFRSDRLPAMAGLVSYFQEKTNDSPCLGLWSKTLSHDLAWMRGVRLGNQQAS